MAFWRAFWGFFGITYFPYGCPRASCMGKASATVVGSSYLCDECKTNYEVKSMSDGRYWWTAIASDGSKAIFEICSCPLCGSSLSNYALHGEDHTYFQCMHCEEIKNKDSSTGLQSKPGVPASAIPQAAPTPAASPEAEQDQAYDAMGCLTAVGVVLAVPGGIALALALMGVKIVAVGRVIIFVFALAMCLGPALGWLYNYRQSRRSNREHLVLGVYTVLSLVGTAFGYLMVHLKWIAWAATGD